ncbi:zinc finger protein 37-like [Lytechinus variegatus]|uniref:zinc finger protein 37-like n=1 Tax=Lytechinus variegatus TaxID=7654 RepID=UPI001BB1CBEA|nr:zinc finger protein 37-like [Lytechinus variegatus]
MTEIKNTAVQGEDSTPMWSFISAEDDKAVMSKFQIESSKVVEKWSMGNASVVEKDAAVSFLIQLGFAQITVQYDDHQSATQKQVTIQLDVGQNKETEHADSGQAKDGVCSQEITATPATAQPSTAPQQQSAEKEQSDDEDNGNYSAWMSESNDTDDNDAMGAEDGVHPSTTQQLREEHPCPSCHAVFHSTWELDLHRVQDCEELKESTQQVYNCDQCTRSFRMKLPFFKHLRDVHDCDITSSQLLEKLEGLKSTKRQSNAKKDERESLKKGRRKRSKKDARKNSKKNARKTNEPPARRSGRLQNLRELREQTKQQTVARKKKRIVRDVQEEKTQTKSDRTNTPPHLKTQVLPDLKLRIYDTLKRMTIKSGNSPVTSDVGTAEQRHDSDEHQVVETLCDNPNGTGQGSSVHWDSEKESHTPIISGESVIDCRDRETPVLPVPEVELEEKDSTLTVGNQDGRGEPCEANEQEKGGDSKKGSDSQEAGTKTGRKKSRKSGKLVCGICHLEFPSIHFQRKHIFESHKECRYFYQKCSTCGKIFTNKSQYKSHVITHADIEERKKNQSTVKVQCKWCDKTYDTASGLSKHVNSKHTKKKTYPCELCGKVFYIAEKMRMHVLCHSKEDRAFKCEECGKGFVALYFLKNHKATVHSNVHQSLCDLCGASFKYKGSLQQHYNTVHSNVYNFKCEVCGKKFQRATLLNAHMKIHSSDASAKPFKCEQCGKCFRTRYKLKVHLDWHNNIRSHTCEVCGKSFLTKGNLTKHMYTHQDKKPHECRICNRGFSDMPALRRHLDVVHKITLKRVLSRMNPEVTKSAESAVADVPSARSPPPAKSGAAAYEGESAEFGNIEDSAATDGEVEEALLEMMNA